MIEKDSLKSLSRSDIHGIIEDLETLGLCDPMNKIFHDLPHSSYFVLFWVIFVISMIPKIILFGNSNTKAVLKKIGQRTDGLPLVIGLAVIFKHYNRSLVEVFVEFYSVYIKSCVETLASLKTEMTLDLAVAIRFLEIFLTFTKHPQCLQKFIPDAVFNNYENWLTTH